MTAPIPANETERLARLRDLFILDSEPEAVFDRLVESVAALCEVPVAVLTLVDAERQWFKAQVGLPGIRQTPRDVSFCAHLLQGDASMEVPDVQADARFRDSALVIGEPGIRFFAGAALSLGGDVRIGALCIIDRQPRRLSAQQTRLLQHFAAVATEAIVMRRQLIDKSLAVGLGYARGLQEGESRYRAIVEDQSELVSLARLDGELVYVNPAYARMFGRTPPQMVGTSLFDLIVPADREAVRTQLDATLRVGRNVSGENRMLAADGAERWVAWTNTLQQPAGAEPMFHSVGRDITDRRALKIRLASAAADWQDLYDNAPCGYHSVDAQGKYAEINATELTWLGCTRDEAIGRLGPIDFLTPESQAVFHANFANFVRTGTVQNLQFDLIGRHGGRRRVSVSAVAQIDAAGNFVRSRSVMYDITALHEATLQNTALLREQAAMIDTDLVGMVKLHRRREVWHNRGLRSLFGYAAHELDGQSSRILYTDDATYEALGREAYRQMARGEVYRGEVPMRRKDGHQLWVAVYGAMVDPATDESLWLLADLTAVKEAEDTRMRATEVEAENRALVEVARARSKILSTMSHELRTPLNGVLGFAHLLQSNAIGPDSPKYDRYLSQIGACGRQLQSLIDALLDAAALQTGTVRFVPQFVDMDALFTDTVDSYRAAGEPRRIELHTQARGLGTAWLDAMRFRQVLGALLSNAIKFSDDGALVTVRAEAAGDGRIRFSVQDEGCGIAAADLSRVFSAFGQLDGSHTRTAGGAGLGLSLVKQLVVSQGGEVGVVSEPGVGSTFHFVLPTAVDRAAAA